MAKKKKTAVNNILHSTRKKRVSELVKSGFDDDAESKDSKMQAALKGRPQKAIKKAISESLTEDKKKSIERLGKEEYKKRLDNSKLTQAVLKGSPQKAIKGLVLEPFRIEQEKQKALNKEYRKERAKLIRRINYFEKKGFEFNTESIAPKLDKNATPQDIQELRELRGKALKDLASSYTPPQKETIISDEPDISDIINEDNSMEIGEDDSVGITYNDDMFENDPENYIDEDDFHPTFDDLIYTGDDDFDTKVEDFETPIERYYNENSDRKCGGDDEKISVGMKVLANAWDMIHGQDIYLGTMPMKEGNKAIKEDATYKLTEMLSKAEEGLGTEKLALILQMHAEEFNKAVEKALYWRDSTDIDLTRSETAYALTQINNILFSYDPALLTENETGNPEDL